MTQLGSSAGSTTLELIESVMADARLAASAASPEAADRLEALSAAAPPGLSAARTSYTSSPLAAAIDGPGLFVFESAGRRSYGRLGDFHVDERGALVDAQRRAVMGYRTDANGTPFGSLTGLAAHAPQLPQGRYTSFRIDERGVLSAISRMRDARTHELVEKTDALGRIALGVFPAPERLAAADGTTLRATLAAGKPSIGPAADQQMSPLRPHALENSLVDLQHDLARLWKLRRQAECETAIAGASDQCIRSALALVK